MIRILAMTVLASLLFAGSAAAQSDQIIALDGDITRGEIKKITKDEVEFDERGNSRKLPRSQIRSIVFAGEPRELKAARDAAAQDKPDEAADQLAKINLAEVDKPLVKQEIAYLQAWVAAQRALAGGDKAAAETQLLAYLRANGDSFHYFDAAELVGDVAFAAGKYELAGRYYSALGNSAAPDLKLRAALLEGRSLLAKGDSLEAAKRFETVLASSLNDEATARLKARAMVGKGRCQIEAGQIDEGLALVKGVIDTNDPKEAGLFAVAHTAMGSGYLKANRKKDAVIEFLYVDLLFPADAEAHAEALYHLEKLWTEQGKTDRAQAARNLLRERYGGTSWASRP